MTDRLKMDPNLVGSSGENLAKDEGPTERFLDNFEPCLSRPPTINNSHFLTVHGMTANRLYNFASRCHEFPGAQRQVEFLNFSSGKLIAQPQVRDVMFGNHEATAGLLVQPVDHPRAKHTPDSA